MLKKINLKEFKDLYRKHIIRDFPKNERFHTFLLNESNHVVLIGNPLGRENMWKLYLQQIDSITQRTNHSINYKTL